MVIHQEKYTTFIINIHHTSLYSCRSHTSAKESIIILINRVPFLRCLFKFHRTYLHFMYVGIYHLSSFFIKLFSNLQIPYQTAITSHIIILFSITVKNIQQIVQSFERFNKKKQLHNRNYILF